MYQFIYIIPCVNIFNTDFSIYAHFKVEHKSLTLLYVFKRSCAE